MAVRYLGQETLTYNGFIDAATGRTLVCEPGGIYEVLPASLSEGAVPNDGRFAELAPPAVTAAALPDPEAEEA